MTSEVLPATDRRFASFTDAVREAGRARTWGGVHTSLDDGAGQLLGRRVARYVERLRTQVR